MPPPNPPSEDSAELRRAAEAVRESEEKFRSIVESSPMGMLFYRLEPGDRLVFTGANPAADAILGVDARQFIGKTIEEAFPPLAETELPDRYRRACRTGEPWSTEQIDYRDDQIQGAYEVHAFRTGPGTMAVIFADITERRRVEEALAASEARYRTLFESAGEAIFLVRGVRFIDCNPMALEMFGCTREQIVGSSPIDFSPSKQPDGQSSAEKAEGLLNRSLAGEVLAFEWVHRRLDGTDFFAEVTLNRLELAGELLLVAHTRDITRQKRMEERLLQAHKMETVGQLAGGVAHDFNNLLAPILGYADLLLGETDPRDPQYPELEAIRQAAERARVLTRQLLAFSRKQVLEPRVLNLNEIVTEFGEILDRTIREDVELRLSLDPDLENVRADAHQLEQVLMNLAVNASDSMEGPGILTIETANVEHGDRFPASLAEPAPDPHVMLAVSDTGAGMDEATRRRVFEPFFTTKEEGKGTGLGLATVYGIVKQHRGSVSVHSRVGAGSRFEIHLPAVETPLTTPVSPAPDVEVASGSERIAVVEDNRMVRDLACRVLASHGYRTLAAETAEECLAKLADLDEPIDLLLTDVVMPGMNGRELFETLLEDRPGLKVLYMSGYTYDVIADRGVLEEGVQLIQKPFSVRELTRRVREVLGG